MNPKLPSMQELVAEATAGSLDPAVVTSWLHLASPRVRFLKSLPINSTVLDLGAGDGALAIFKDWLEPLRPDLKLYAVSLGAGAHFHRYEGYELVDFDKGEPGFGGMVFDAMYSSNFVEHIDGGIDRLSEFAFRRLRCGGMLYVEGPSPFMEEVPRREEFHAVGLPVVCGNFRDDKTHRATITLQTQVERTQAAGFFVEESGYIRNRYIEDDMLRIARRDANEVYATLAVWMKYYVSQYAISTKV